MTKKSILVVTDLTPSSELALQWALDFASQFNLKLNLLFCYRLIPSDGMETSNHVVNMKKKIEKETLDKFATVKKHIIDRTPVPIQFHMEVGFYFHRIEEFVKKNGISWVVMANDFMDGISHHEERTFNEFVANSLVPIMIVPSGALKPVSGPVILGSHNN